MSERLSSREAREAIQAHVEAAHREVQAAQRIAYGTNLNGECGGSLRTRLALNRTQDTLIRLLVRFTKGHR